MAIIKCPECGNQVSDKAVQCPHCGFSMKKKNLIDNYRKIITETIIIIAVAFTVLLICKLYDNNETKYPDIIGRIHLDMSQEDVEEILKSEIEDLYYSDLAKEDEVEIFICDSVDGKKLSQMQYSKEHPGVDYIKFTFDDKKKLKNIQLTVAGNTFEAVKEFGLGCEYDDLETFYHGLSKQKYCVVEQTRIEIIQIENFANLGTYCFVDYKRLKDIEE